MEDASKAGLLTAATSSRLHPLHQGQRRPRRQPQRGQGRQVRHARRAQGHPRRPRGSHHPVVQAHLRNEAVRVVVAPRLGPREVHRRPDHPDVGVVRTGKKETLGLLSLCLLFWFLFQSRGPRIHGGPRQHLAGSSITPGRISYISTYPLSLIEQIEPLPVRI